MLKPHVVGLFVKELKDSSYDEVTDFLFLRFERFGELLNCKYCISGYVGLFFFTLFRVLPEMASLYVTSFFAMPLLIELVLGSRANPIPTPKESKPSSLPETTSEGMIKIGEEAEAFEAKENAEDHDSEKPFWRLELTPELREKIDEVKKDPEKHKKFLVENPDILGLISADKPNCNFPDCERLIAEYKGELQAMLKEHQRDPISCPECMRGTVINKYVFQLIEARDKHREEQAQGEEAGEG